MRLFLGLSAPLDYSLQPLREHLRQLIPAPEARKDSDNSLRFLRKSDLHITLKFLGSVGEAELPRVVAIAADQLSAFGPLFLSARSVGLFKGAVWVGIVDNERLRQMAGALNEAFIDLGITAESRPYHPHVTVARFRSRAGFAPEGLTGKFEEKHWGGFTAAKAFLYRSDTLPEGARYTIIKSFLLATR